LWRFIEKKWVQGRPPVVRPTTLIGITIRVSHPLPLGIFKLTSANSMPKLGGWNHYISYCVLKAEPCAPKYGFIVNVHRFVKVDLPNFGRETRNEMRGKKDQGWRDISRNDHLSNWNKWKICGGLFPYKIKGIRQSCPAFVKSDRWKSFFFYHFRKISLKVSFPSRPMIESMDWSEDYRSFKHLSYIHLPSTRSTFPYLSHLWTFMAAHADRAHPIHYTVFCQWSHIGRCQHKSKAHSLFPDSPNQTPSAEMMLPLYIYEYAR